MFARQLILAWVLLGILAHSYNSCTCKAETGERVPGQPGFPVKTNIKKKKKRGVLVTPNSPSPPLPAMLLYSSLLLGFLLS